MSKVIICSVCGGMNIQTEKRPDGYRHCLDCGSHWKIGSEQVFKKQTVFDRITSSQEVLAEKLVYCELTIHERPDIVELTKGWYSTIIRGKVWSNESEAITATVAKLNEVEK